MSAVAMLLATAAWAAAALGPTISGDVLEVKSVGDVVTARGVVRTDVALGAGYAFKVLLEDASLQK